MKAGAALSARVGLTSLSKTQFDGDEMNAEILIDMREHEAFRKLAPHFGVLDTHTPLSVSGNVKIPPPTMNTWVEFIHEGE